MFRRNGKIEKVISESSDPRRYQLWHDNPEADFFSPPILTPDTISYLEIKPGQTVGDAFSERFSIETAALAIHNHTSESSTDTHS